VGNPIAAKTRDRLVIAVRDLGDPAIGCAGVGFDRPQDAPTLAVSGA